MLKAMENYLVRVHWSLTVEAIHGYDYGTQAVCSPFLKRLNIEISSDQGLHHPYLGYKQSNPFLGMFDASD